MAMDDKTMKPEAANEAAVKEEAATNAAADTAVEAAKTDAVESAAKPAVETDAESASEVVKESVPPAAEAKAAVKAAEAANAAAAAAESVTEESAAGKSSNRREVTGVVVGNKADKTVRVRIERRVKHPIYGKFIRRHKSFAAHDPSNECEVGDTVVLVESPRISKTKAWRVLERKGRSNS